jgi:hypothetical protein
MTNSNKLRKVIPMWRFLFVYLLFGLGCARAETLLIKSTDGGQTWVDIAPDRPIHFSHGFV